MREHHVQPTTCVNHPAAETLQTCQDCGRPFCDRCLVTLMGTQRCETCKEAAVRGVSVRPARHPLAAMSLVIPVAGYFLCLPIPITSAVGLWLGRKVLRDLERQPHLSGRGAALAAIVVSGGTLVTWMIALAATLYLWLEAIT
jgi:hypothetical protein